MSIERSDSVYLPIDEPRCVPQGICLQASTCARRVAAVVPGSTMTGAGMPALPIGVRALPQSNDVHVVQLDQPGSHLRGIGMPQVNEQKKPAVYGLDYWADWLRIQASQGRRVGLDFVRISVSEAETIARCIEQAAKDKQ